MLVDRSYLYIFQKDLSDGVQSWECQLRRKQQCKAKLKVIGGHPVVQKRHYADSAARVLNVVEDYPQRRQNIHFPISYLEAIAYNLSY